MIMYAFINSKNQMLFPPMIGRELAERHYENMRKKGYWTDCKVYEIEVKIIRDVTPYGELGL